MACSDEVKHYLSACRNAGRKRQFNHVCSNAEKIMSIEGLPIHITARAATFAAVALFEMGNSKDALVAINKAWKLETSSKNEKRHTPHANRRRQHLRKIRYEVHNILGHAEEMDFMKFPRTRHVFDASTADAATTAVTRDDLVLSKTDASLMCDGKKVITVTEKIDGANFGIQVNHDGRLICQNRSHYISSGEHAQFSKLATWLSQHETTLRKILNPPGRFILFGEWLAAKHSIHYDQLPALFVAFDLYDRDFGDFLDTKSLLEVLREANRGQENNPIFHVPILARQTFENPKQLLPFLQRQSLFRSAGTLEGIYLKIDDIDSRRVHSRVKLVRPDFTAGIQDGHWMKRDIIKNSVDYQFSINWRQHIDVALKLFEVD